MNLALVEDRAENPPVKTVLEMMGMIRGELRLPLCEMSPANSEKLRKVLTDYKLV